MGEPVLRSPTGSFGGKSTQGLHKTYCGMFGESTKGGEREGLGENKQGKAEEKDTKGDGRMQTSGWLVLLSGQAVNAVCVSTVFLI